MDDQAIATARIYTDFNNLNQLKYDAHGKNSPELKREVAQQFEAILMQMVLSSMRNANKSFKSDLLGSDQMDLYQDLYDKQLSLVLSNSENSFASIVEKAIDRMQGNASQAPSGSWNKAAALQEESQTMSAAQYPGLVGRQDSKFNPEYVHGKEYVVSDLDTEPVAKPEPFNGQEDFVRKLWMGAKRAASMIGSSPEILLAQAALETNWGKNIISQHNESTHSLFNIKADASWKQKTAIVDSLEERNGVLVKEKSSFRSYDNYHESFMDYANFLKGNQRYNDTLSNASNPKEFVHSLQRSGYATDHEYANKIMKIFNSNTFQTIIEKVKSMT